MPKLDGERFKKLSEEQLIGTLADCLSGKIPFALILDAFLMDDRNLWHGTYVTLFGKVGLEDSWRWVCNHHLIQKYLSDVRGNAATAESELKDFILYRNQAAHGDIDEIASKEEIAKFGEFICSLCEASAEFVAHRALRKRVELKLSQVVGSVIKEFSKTLVGVQISNTKLTKGDKVFIVRENCCYEATVQSLGYKSKHYDFLTVDKTENIGIKFDVRVKLDSQIVLLESKENEQHPLKLLQHLPNASNGNSAN